MDTTPVRVVDRADQAASLPSFAAYMDRCLHDRDFGYYGGGRVRFGHGRHFWTYPKRLRPLFGWMVADSVRFLLDPLLERSPLPRGAPITLLELGAGDGDLARDVLDRVQALSASPEWRDLAPRLRYVIGERSPELRERQRRNLEQHVSAGRAEVRDIDAQALSWEGPFNGIVLCNELITAFACERILVHAPFVSPERPGAGRIHVASRFGPEGRVLDETSLWAKVAAGRGRELEISELEVPLDLGWVSDGAVAAPPAELLGYLEGLAPLTRDLEACALLPTYLHWSQGVAGFVGSLGSLLSGPDRYGVALVVDYGGTSRHVLDPRSSGWHLRVYGEDETLAHRCAPYVDPGNQDITWDLDFTHLGRLAAEVGLEMCHYGHQSMLEASTVDLWSAELRPLVVAGREAEGYEPGEVAEVEAERLVGSFREAAGFRTAIVGPAGFVVPEERFGPSDAVADDGLDTIAAEVDEATLAEALTGLDVEDASRRLLPCCDVVANLSDLHLYAEREAVLRALRERGLLRPPGACCDGSGRR